MKKNTNLPTTKTIIITLILSAILTGCTQNNFNEDIKIDDQPNNIEDPTDENIIPDEYDNGAEDYNKKPLGKEFPQGQYLEDPSDADIIPDTFENPNE